MDVPEARMAVWCHKKQNTEEKFCRMFEVLLTVKIVNIEMIVNAFKNSWKDDLSKKSV